MLSLSHWSMSWRKKIVRPLRDLSKKMLTDYCYQRKLFRKAGIEIPDNSLNNRELLPNSITPLSPDIVEEVRKSGAILRKILDGVQPLCKPGVSTLELEAFVLEKCLDHKVYPSCLNYREFPSCCCTSINQVACHGIPRSDVLLQRGDIVSVDLGVFNGKAHADACETFLVLEDDPPIDEYFFRQDYLITSAREIMEAGINACRPGANFSDIAEAITAEAFACSLRIVAGIGGHTIGEFFHGNVYIPHSIFELTPTNIASIAMEPGMVFTIEPVVTEASAKDDDLCVPPKSLGDGMHRFYALAEVDPSDGWSVRTSDRKLTAQFEHTVAITDDGVEVLTA